jgi:GT2 family glycosyltransferase
MSSPKNISQASAGLDLTITIPVFNQLHYTKDCVETLLASGVTQPQIVIVNNASTDGTMEYLAGFPDIPVINNLKNEGCAFAWNQGSKASRSKWTLVSNNDILFAPGTLSGLISFAEEENMDIASGAMCEGDVDYDFNGYAGDFMRIMACVARRNVARGSCFMVHRRAFEKLGYFNEDPKLGGYEDDEFFRRARAAGLKLAITGRSFYHHYGSVTQKSIKAELKKPDFSLGDRKYYRKQTGQTWARRKAVQVKHAIRKLWWKNNEKLRYGRTLHEKRIDGQWHFC